MISISDVLSFMRWNGFPCLWSKQSLAGFSISFAGQSEPCFSYFEFASQNFTFKNPPLIHVRLKFWIGFLYRWSNFFQDKDQNFYRSEKLSKIYKILLKDCLVISSIFEILEEFFVMRISSESEEVEINSVGILIFLHQKQNGSCHKICVCSDSDVLLHYSVCPRYCLVLSFAWNSFIETLFRSTCESLIGPYSLNMRSSAKTTLDPVSFYSDLLLIHFFQTFSSKMYQEYLCLKLENPIQTFSCIKSIKNISWNWSYLE